MRLGLRGKLFVSLALVVLVVGAATGAWLEANLRGWLEQRIEGQLLEEARAVRELLLVAPVLETAPQVDPLADGLGEALEARVTIVAPDGLLIGDSELDLSGVSGADNHSGRPEILQAAARGSGSSRRYSETIKTDMLYVAVPWEREGRRGFARVALPLSEVEETLAQARALVLVAILAALVVALLFSGLASHLLAQILGRVLQNLRGQLDRPGAGTVGDELQTLMSSSEWIAEELDRRVQELASERDRFEAVLEAVDAGVVAIDSDGLLVTLNAAARGVLGLPSGVLGKPFVEVARDVSLHELLENEAGDASMEISLSGPPPREVLVRSSRAPSGAVVAVFHDITELRRLELVRRDFVANASHELRTPAAVLQANAETLLDGALDDPQAARRFVEAMHRNSTRLTSLLSDLLDLSRIEAGRYAMDPGRFGVSEAFARVIETLGTLAEEQGVGLSWQAPAELIVLADQGALDQVLLNLTDNAIKYTPSGGSVVLRAELRDDWVQMKVCDDGPGIPEEHRGRLFERFYRVEPGRSRTLGGTGLGLAIVKHLTQSMGGSVGFEPGEPGSVFWLELPS